MNFNKEKMVVSVLATSVALPMMANIAYANENNIQIASVEYRTITGNGVNFRTGPSTGNSSIGKFYKGDKVEYISTSGSWVQIKYNGKTGYVHGDYVSKSQGSESNNGSTVSSKKVVTGSSVNFRKGPGTSYSKIATLSKGTEVGYISESGGWSKISYNGKIGYMSSQYLGNNTTGTPSTDNSDKDNSCTDVTVISKKIVTGNSVNFRKGPGTSYSKIATLPKGTEVGYISESGGWSKISYNGKVGYMSSQYLGNKTAGTPSTGDTNTGNTNTDNTVKSTKIVTGGSVNLRTGPGTSYSKIATLTRGTEVGYISESGGWSKISHNGKVGYMSSNYIGDKGSINIPDVETGGVASDRVIDFAKKLLGKPYVWGAEGPNSFDCSGFTQYVYKQVAGVSIPRVSREQSKFGKYVSKSELQKGDLVFFDTDGSNNGVVTHAGIYMGNGEVINASSGAGKVIISDLNSSYYSSRFVNARRVL